MEKVIAFILLICINLFASDHYVRSGATGSADGTDWDNAWTDTANINWAGISPGDSIWVAAGNYTTIQPASSGTTNNPITIYRARTTNSVPASATGWNSSFDGQVTIASASPVIFYNDSYITIDGQVPYTGIILTNTVLDSYNNDAWVVLITGVSTNISVKNCALRLGNSSMGAGPASSSVSRMCFGTTGGTWPNCNRLDVQYCDIAWGEHLIVLLNASNLSFKYNRIHGNFRSPTGAHPGVFSAIGCTNVVFAFNDVGYSDGFLDNGLMLDFVSVSDAPNDTWHIYGNIFHNSRELARALTPQYIDQYRIFFFNNTMVDLSFGIQPTSGQGGGWDSSCVASNNIMINCGADGTQAGFANGNDDYNLSDQTTAGTHSISDATSAIFVNYAGGNYQLATNIIGVTLSEMYNADILGNMRTTWSIGAYEYQAGTSSIQRRPGVRWKGRE